MLLVQVVLNGLTAGAMLALMSIGLTLIFGILGVVNFVHGVIFMLGAYITIYFTAELGMNYFVSIMLACVLGAILGVVLEAAFFRRFRGKVLEGAVFAVALALSLEALAFEIFGGAPRGVQTPLPGVINVAGLIVNKHRLLVVAAALLLVLGLYWFVRSSRYGRAMRAVQQDAYAARLQGIEDSRIAVLTFAIGAALAAVAGGLVAPLQLALPDMGTTPLLLAFVVIIVGGMGSISGAFWAAVLIGLVQSAVTTFWSPQAVIGVTFFIAMLMLALRPTGIAGHAH
jgi:branched-chain amino acid transport system permease protein